MFIDGCFDTIGPTTFLVHAETYKNVVSAIVLHVFDVSIIFTLYIYIYIYVHIKLLQI